MKKLRERILQLGVWLRDHKTEVTGLVCVLVLFLVIDPVHAQGPDVNQSIMLFLARLFAWIATTAVRFIIILIDFTVIPVLQYNGFTTSAIVTQGWVVVRDLVNMFFVIVLLLIAFQTIFGIGRANWRQQVPRLLIMAILINFSKTIAGILIDFGQVVMITFVNAIKDVAGGNFIQLFGLSDLFRYSDSTLAKLAESGQGTGIYEMFVASFLTMVVSFILLGTMLILAALFAFRIVILWILVIMSPLAFFLGGAKGVIGQAESYYADWWKRLSSAVVLGPMLTFFLWLALAAAGTGNLAEQQGFVTTQANTEETNNISGIITRSFDSPRMTSMVIAVALLFAGFEISQSTASGVGGRAAKIAQKGISGMPALGGAIAMLGARGAGAAALAPAAYTYKSSPVQEARRVALAKTGAALQAGGLAFAKIPVVGGIGRRVGFAGAKLQAGVTQEREKMRSEATASLKGMSTDQLKALADTPITAMTTPADKVMIQAAQDKRFLSGLQRKKMNAEEKEQAAGQFWQRAEDGEFDDDTLDKIGKPGGFLFTDPQLLLEKADFKGKTDEEKQEKIDEHMQNVLRRPGALRDISSQALGNKFVQESLRKQKVGRTGMTGEEYILDGRAGDVTQKAYEENFNKSAEAFNTEAVGGYQGKMAEIAAERAKPGADMAALGEREATAMRELIDEIKKLSAHGIKAGAVTAGTMAVPGFAEAFGNNASKEALAAMPPDVTAAFNEALDRSDEEYTQYFTDSFDDNGNLVGTTTDHEGLRNNPQAKETYDRNTKARIRAKQAPAGYDTVSGQFESGSVGEQAKESLQRVVTENPELLTDMKDQLGDFKNEIATAIRDAVNSNEGKGGQTVLKKLAGKLTGPSTPDETQSVINAINNLQRVMFKTISATEKNSAVLAKVAHIKRRAGLK